MSPLESISSESADSKAKNPMLVLGPVLAIGASTLIYNFGVLDLDAAITLGIALWTALWGSSKPCPYPSPLYFLFHCSLFLES